MSDADSGEAVLGVGQGANEKPLHLPLFRCGPKTALKSRLQNQLMHVESVLPIHRLQTSNVACALKPICDLRVNTRRPSGAQDAGACGAAKDGADTTHTFLAAAEQAGPLSASSSVLMVQTSDFPASSGCHGFTFLSSWLFKMSPKHSANWHCYVSRGRLQRGHVS